MGQVGSLRRFKDDVAEVQHGYECGIGIANYNDVKIGDVIEAYGQCEFATQWTYLPMYYLSLVLDRIPGKQYALWGIFVIGTTSMRSGGASDTTTIVVVLSWLGVCIYTWLAGPVTRLWMKWKFRNDPFR